MKNYQYNLYTDTRAAATRFNDAELITAFPEAKQIAIALIKELDARRQALVLYIAAELTAIKVASTDEVYHYFWRLWLILNEGEMLQELDNKLARLKRLLRTIKGEKPPKGALPDGAIEAAREYPIRDLFDKQFRRSGYNLVGLCPFHDERTPSFYIFTKQNRAHCFGCGKSVDAIDAYMALNDCDFKTAVAALSGGQA